MPEFFTWRVRLAVHARSGNQSVPLPLDFEWIDRDWSNCADWPGALVAPTTVSRRRATRNLRKTAQSKCLYCPTSLTRERERCATERRRTGQMRLDGHHPAVGATSHRLLAPHGLGRSSLNVCTDRRDGIGIAPRSFTCSSRSTVMEYRHRSPSCVFIVCSGAPATRCTSALDTPRLVRLSSASGNHLPAVTLAWADPRLHDGKHTSIAAKGI